MSERRWTCYHEPTCASHEAHRALSAEAVKRRRCKACQNERDAYPMSVMFLDHTCLATPGQGEGEK